jgi:hypothetical protein
MCHEQVIHWSNHLKVYITNQLVKNIWSTVRISDETHEITHEEVIHGIIMNNILI